jgi:methionyl-tRNA synthetase/aminoacyl tRNA synthase complex-interacting multifunctional protein 1
MNFEGEEEHRMPKTRRKKIFEASPFMVTSKYGVQEFLGRPFMTSAGVCTSPIRRWKRSVVGLVALAKYVGF